MGVAAVLNLNYQSYVIDDGDVRERQSWKAGHKLTPDVTKPSTRTDKRAKRSSSCATDARATGTFRNLWRYHDLLLRGRGIASIIHGWEQAEKVTSDIEARIALY